MIRALVQKCDGLKVHRLITMGSPHQGVNAFPGCGDANGWAKWSPSRWVNYLIKKIRQKLIPCSVMNTLVGTSVYSSSAQNNIMPAQYYKDPKKMPNYYRANKFLVDVNNELSVSSGRLYKERTLCVAYPFYRKRSRNTRRTCSVWTNLSFSTLIARRLFILQSQRYKKMNWLIYLFCRHLDTMDRMVKRFYH